MIAWANVAGKHASVDVTEQWSLTTVAPVIAPIAAGWIVENTSLGWRWTEWMTLNISGAAFTLALLFLPETYLPILLDWKAKQLRRVTGDERYVSEHAQSASFIKRLRQVLPLPAKFWAKEPVISILATYFVLLYVLLFTFLYRFDYILTRGNDSRETKHKVGQGLTALL